MVGYAMLQALGEILLGLIEWKANVGKLLARLLWSGTGMMTENRSSDDPAYKKNLQRLIEHHRRFEESKE
ncbi:MULTISPECIES: hypothetical protein [unclassified Bradyrhizobium]|uniref:hypothetical protein n=1 Tax=unclassified Bradyrhizobium TaxID=2631580 RepID=UPI0020B2F7AA|nr:MULTISPECIES: hypothetical protein [unclassified Bradyrhizobium]MCP3381704.1 hypothetical protein [Bradyrhizobium sp. CCGUVB4N]MCP3442784.1 hypothetical protein [Bradyrhizobium sp. CCGUVB14]